MVALTWYSLSYIPYGRQLFQRFILPLLKPVIKVVRAAFSREYAKVARLCLAGALHVMIITGRPRFASWRGYGSSLTLISLCCAQPSYTCFWMQVSAMMLRVCGLCCKHCAPSLLPR